MYQVLSWHNPQETSVLSAPYLSELRSHKSACSTPSDCPGLRADHHRCRWILYTWGGLRIWPSASSVPCVTPRAPRPPDWGSWARWCRSFLARPGNRCILWDLLSPSLQGWWCNGSTPKSQRNPGLAFFPRQWNKGAGNCFSGSASLSSRVDNRRSRKWARPANRCQIPELARPPHGPPGRKGRRVLSSQPAGRWIFFLSESAWTAHRTCARPARAPSGGCAPRCRSCSAWTARASWSRTWRGGRGLESTGWHTRQRPGRCGGSPRRRAEPGGPAVPGAGRPGAIAPPPGWCWHAPARWPHSGRTPGPCGWPGTGSPAAGSAPSPARSGNESRAFPGVRRSGVGWRRSPRSRISSSWSEPHPPWWASYCGGHPTGRRWGQWIETGWCPPGGRRGTVSLAWTVLKSRSMRFWFCQQTSQHGGQKYCKNLPSWIFKLFFINS